MCCTIKEPLPWLGDGEKLCKEGWGGGYKEACKGKWSPLPQSSSCEKGLPPAGELMNNPAASSWARLQLGEELTAIRGCDSAILNANEGPFPPSPKGGGLGDGSSKLRNGSFGLSFFLTPPPPHTHTLYFLKGPEIWSVIISSHCDKEF